MGRTRKSVTTRSASRRPATVSPSVTAIAPPPAVASKQSSRPHECPVCHQCFRGKHFLANHARTHLNHSTKAPITASPTTTAKTTTTTTKENNNVDDQKPSSPKQFACDSCDKKYRFAHGLRNHRQTHTGIKPHECTLCHKAFTQRTFLTIHLRSHTNERPFTCPVNDCTKAFHQRSHLRYHLLTHSRRRGFACHVCGTRLRYKQSLQLHLRIHGSEKPFACDTCGKAFHEKPKLRIHQRTHTGEKPYACSICSRSFAQKGNRDKHLQRYHARDRERKFPCALCPKAFIWKKCLDMHVTWHRVQDERQDKKKTKKKRKKTATAVSEPPPASPLRPETPTGPSAPNNSVGLDEFGPPAAIDETKPSPLEAVKRESTPRDDGDDVKVLTSYQNGQWVVVPRASEESSATALEEEQEEADDDDEEEEEAAAEEECSLRDNMKRLLPHLLDDEVLQEIGWPDVNVERMVAQVLRWCDQKPAASARRDDEDEVFECNVQLLLNIVLEEKFTEAGDLRGMSSNDIVRELLKLSAIT